MKEATSKVIPLFPRNDGNSRYNKLYQSDPKLILTVIIIFDIPLCNSKGTLPFFSKRLFAKMLEHFLNKYRAEISDNSIAYLKNITILTSEHHNMQYRKNYTFFHECLLMHFKFSTWGHYFCVFYWRRYWISYPVPTLRWFEIPRSSHLQVKARGLYYLHFSVILRRGVLVMPRTGDQTQDLPLYRPLF